MHVQSLHIRAIFIREPKNKPKPILILADPPLFQTFVNRDLKSISMVFTEFVQIGGVVYVPSLKKACAITNVIDLNR